MLSRLLLVRYDSTFGCMIWHSPHRFGFVLDWWITSAAPSAIRMPAMSTMLVMKLIFAQFILRRLASLLGGVVVVDSWESCFSLLINILRELHSVSVSGESRDYSSASTRSSTSLIVRSSP